MKPVFLVKEQSKSTENRARCKSKLKLVHTDLAGPIHPIAKEGFKYAISFTDDYSGVVFVYFLKQKSDAYKACERFIADCAPQGKVKCIRSDNGTEFTGKDFQDVLVKNGIKHECSAPYSPHQNGVAERGWRTLFDMARCLLINTKLPKSLWTYAVMMSAYIRNRCYNQRTQQTPFFMFTGMKPNLNKIQEFGTLCYAYDNAQKLKLDARTKQGVFVGFDKGSPAYLVYHESTQSVRKYRCVTFVDKKRLIIDVPQIHKDVCDDVYQDVNKGEIKFPSKCNDKIPSKTISKNKQKRFMIA